ncbi:hydantoinase/oxoprolinase family protein [Bradyrhizobium sp. CCGUVB23]|uniref:hydantoinase/oxoprolinase family protein n=1 Tax=Bradyrhizobium sp. CCGUVB23 TaxID=2949630 RepID=UPI0020B3A059|nr:hydantoinase/oxoprolinase family protein [Bradyrhizobium sp. CCGUVB23]MCP3461050.1 hydantoinase/oxoprolinase family protein [Bradyrhizobium sp. CCGUVB23]
MLDKVDGLPTVRVGVDSGGTFTDVCIYDTGKKYISIWKVSSTPQDPSVGIAGGIEQGLLAYREATNAKPVVEYVGHGTTVATNALIVGRGAETGMITTAGFRDVLELRRQKRDALYDLQTEKPPILARRDRRLEVKERVLFDGRILVPLAEEEVRTAARKLRSEGVKAIAVCCLFSFIDARHEQTIKRIVLEEFPEAFLSVSHEVAPEFREYERFSTTVVNAYLGPVMRQYLQRLEPRLEELGISVEPHLTQSNGGVISAETAQNFPVRTVLSGPAAGVTGATAIGSLSGFEDLITFDMGGTSTDVSLIQQGRAQTSNEAVVHGYPLKVPMLDIYAVGAGGGSIAYVDAGGMLQVGPRSASAVPGPICYNQGNDDEPTVTDANVVLQILNPTHLLDGRLPIDQAKAKQAIATLGAKLGLDTMATAQGIISVVVANMAKAIRVISVERGYDPREYTLFAFGGAGPIHATRLARALDMRRVVIPKFPGVMCALGLLLTDLRTSLSTTKMQELAEDCGGDIARGLVDLEQRAEAWFEAESIAQEDRKVVRSVDLRYGGQGYEINIGLPEGEIDAKVVAALRSDFKSAHQRLYGYVSEGEPIHITTIRLELTGRVAKVELKPHPAVTTSVSQALKAYRQVWLPEVGGFVDCPLYDRDRLGPEHVIQGPAIIDQFDSTTLVLPGQSANVDPYLNLIIEENDA